MQELLLPMHDINFLKIHNTDTDIVSLYIKKNMFITTWYIGYAFNPLVNP